MPAFEAPDKMDNPTYLRQLCYEGMAKKLPQADQEARDRLEYELGIIEQMGFVDYFLIVWDFIHYAKVNDIMVGPGRGSGAGRPRGVLPRYNGCRSAGIQPAV